MSQTIYDRTFAPRPRRIFARALFALFACAALAASARVASAQSLNAGSPDLVISQVYTRGGEAGASYQKDFVEIFNRGTAPADMNNYGLHMSSVSSNSSVFVRLVSSRGIIVEPGRYVLIGLKGDGAGGQTFTPDFDLSLLPGPVPVNLSTTTGLVVLVAPDGSFQGCPNSQSTGVVDYVGYGATSVCFEGAQGPGLGRVHGRRRHRLRARRLHDPGRPPALRPRRVAEGVSSAAHRRRDAGDRQRDDRAAHLEARGRRRRHRLPRARRRPYPRQRFGRGLVEPD